MELWLNSKVQCIRYNDFVPIYCLQLIAGSSAGAGSGDFHVYRGVRRREYARQKFLNEQEAKVSYSDIKHACSCYLES